MRGRLAFYLTYGGYNRRHLADSIFKCIFLTENVFILIKWSQKYVHKGPIDKSELVMVMAWHLYGAKPFPEPMMTQFPKLYAPPCLIGLMFSSCRFVMKGTKNEWTQLATWLSPQVI